jgi:hypothetical protein
MAVLIFKIKGEIKMSSVGSEISLTSNIIKLKCFNIKLCELSKKTKRLKNVGHLLGIH